MKVEIYYNRYDTKSNLNGIFDGIACPGDQFFFRNTRAKENIVEKISVSKYYFSGDEEIKFGDIAKFKVMGPTKDAFYCESTYLFNHHIFLV